MTLDPNDPFFEGAIRQLVHDETDRLGVLIRQLQGLFGGTGDVTFNVITALNGIVAVGGQVTNVSYVLMPEVIDPAPISNGAYVYARDNGAGKTQLCVQFGTGAVQVLAMEP